MTEPICSWKKFFNDYIYVCEKSDTEESSLASKPLEGLLQIKFQEGNFWDYFICSLKCSGYDSSKYDWNHNICKCVGDWRPPIWRR